MTHGKNLTAVKQLAIYIGNWSIEGTNFSTDPEQPETAVTGENKTEWMTGDFFIIDHWRHIAGDGGHIGISILGYDADAQQLYTRNFDNLGFERKYMIESDNFTWKLTGGTERATRVFSTDGQTFEERWEVLGADQTWKPLCIMHGKKM
ncbi:MAG: DUF1579 family protein [Bacteroidota bacterium]